MAKIQNPTIVMQGGDNRLALFMNNQLEELIPEDFAVGDDVVSIRDYACYGLTNLTKVTLPSGTLTIGTSAFQGCSSLVNINFPNGLTSIGLSAFQNSLQNSDIVLPQSLKLGQQSFQKSGIRSVICGGSLGWHSGAGGTFQHCGSLRIVVIREGTTVLGFALFGDDNLTKLILPSTLLDCSSALNYRTLQNLIIKAEIPPTISSVPTNTTRAFVPIASISQYQSATNWSALSNKYYPLVDTYEDLASVDTTTYTYACVKGNEEYLIYQYIDGQWY